MNTEGLTYQEKVALFERIQDLVNAEVSKRISEMDFKMDILKVHPNDGDTLVLQSKLFLGKKLATQLSNLFKQQVKETYPDQNIKILVLMSKLELSHKAGGAGS